MIVPKRGNMVDGLEKINVSFYAKEMSNSDIEEQIRSLGIRSKSWVTFDFSQKYCLI